jgi:hypothetical protein
MNINVTNEVSTEVGKCSGYTEKLNKWAELTVKYCHGLNMDKKIDRAFFAFQSKPLKKKPEVLLLGLNPMGTANYESQYNNELWGLKHAGGMTPDVFIQQNQWYHGGRYSKEEKGWNILNNLKKTTEVHSDLQDLFDEDKIVYMNILYFNSKDFAEFKISAGTHWKEIYETCVQLSKNLIFEIIKPEKILCLGIDNCYKSFTSPYNSEVLISGSLLKTEINNTPVYGMTHPSARISNAKRKFIGLNLYASLFDKPIVENLEERFLGLLKIIAENNGLHFHRKTKKLSAKFGDFYFQSNKKNTVLQFEFQNALYSDLRYGLYDNYWLNSAKKCQDPYNDWTNLIENFDETAFRKYFDDIVKFHMNKLVK